MKQKYWLQGLIFCAVSGIIFVALAKGSVPDKARFPVYVMAGIFGVVGMQMWVMSIVRDARGMLSPLSAGICSGGLGIIAFWVAYSGERLSGGLPLIPDHWNQGFGRGVFILGGLVCLLITYLAFRDVLRKWRSGPRER